MMIQRDVKVRTTIEAIMQPYQKRDGRQDVVNELLRLGLNKRLDREDEVR